MIIFFKKPAVDPKSFTSLSFLLSVGFQRTEVTRVCGLSVMKVGAAQEFSEKLFIEGCLRLNIT